jgi:hypothetical protein
VATVLVLLIVLGMVLLVACAALWPDREEPAAPPGIAASTPDATSTPDAAASSLDVATSTPNVPTSTPDAAGSSLDVATSLEGALACQLLAGEIDPGQYQRALARLAARDHERHPLSAPPRD